MSGAGTQAATSRARLPEAKRRDATLYLDEFQNFLNLPYAVEDMLAEARGLHLGMVFAHQHWAQLDRDLQFAVSANARTKMYFATSPEDARLLARHTAPNLSEHDLEHLPAFTVAARPFHDGRTLPACTLATLPRPSRPARPKPSANSLPPNPLSPRRHRSLRAATVRRTIMTAAKRQTAADFAALYPRLPERDLAIVDALAVHKILTAPMITAIWFPSEWTARQRILTLTELSVLARFRPGHRAAYRYTLGEWGHTIWAMRNAEKPPTRQWCAWQMQRLAVSRHRAHLEAVDALAARLHADARFSSGTFTITQWLAETEAAEACSGQLRPDAGYVLKWRSGPELRAWHEHDTGTETHTQLITKLRRYARYRPLDGGRSRTVLFTLPSRAREDHFHAGAAREALEFPVATALTTEAGTRPTGAHWRLIGYGKRLALAEIAHRAELP